MLQETNIKPSLKHDFWEIATTPKNTPNRFSKSQRTSIGKHFYLLSIMNVSAKRKFHWQSQGLVLRNLSSLKPDRYDLYSLYSLQVASYCHTLSTSLTVGQVLIEYHLSNIRFATASNLCRMLNQIITQYRFMMVQHFSVSSFEQY